MSTTIKTQAQAVNELRDAIIEFETTGAVNEALVTSVNHSLRDIQVRDFLMGVTVENHSTELVASFVEYLATSAKEEEIAPIYSVLGAYRYQLGNESGAQLALDKAIEANPKHALTLLLRRVMASGWPSGAFASMARELHPKVVAGIEESQCELLIA
jgi:hypothetical protein